MPACGSPWLFAACHVLLRRMVPWHPPCALISLIFSSLFVLRPIVLSLLYHFILHPFQNEELSLQLAFSVQIFSCCAVVKVQGALPFPFFFRRFFVPFASGIQSFDQTLKTIQSSKRNRQLTCMTHVFHVHARAPTLSCCSCSASGSTCLESVFFLRLCFLIDLG